MYSLGHQNMKASEELLGVKAKLHWIVIRINAHALFL